MAGGLKLGDAHSNAVNVEIFAQYIFSRISHRALDARKYDVSEKIIIGQIEILIRCAKICPRENVTWGLMRKNLAARKYLRSQ